MMKKSVIGKDERKRLNEYLKREKKKLTYLSPVFEYDYYSSGWPRIAGKCETFEEYLELSAKLPVDNELYTYDLYWHKEPNDSLVITNKVIYEPGIELYYRFLVGDVERTLEKLTEGKCKIIAKTIKPEETTITTLSCQS